MPRYILTEDAKLDIKNIKRYTEEQWGKGQAKQYLQALLVTIRSIAETPLIGKKAADIDEKVMYFPCKNHVIYYFSFRKKVYVFGVLHKSMLPANHLATRKTH